MKILVTGGTGFAGSRLVRMLLQRGHDVVVLDRQEGLHVEDLKRLGAQVVLGSITDADRLRQTIPGCERVYHLAAEGRRVNLPRSVHLATNATALRSLLTICRDSGVRKVVHGSTHAVHGMLRQVPGDENSPIAPEDYGHHTRHLGEEITREFIAQGMDITVVRPTALYGPGDPAGWLGVLRQVKKGWFPLPGGDGGVCHPLYIDNFCQALERMDLCPASAGQTYIIADEVPVPVPELLDTIADVMGVRLRRVNVPYWPVYAAALATELLFKPLPFEPPLSRRCVDWYRQNHVFSIAKAKRELGYQPEIDVKEGLRRTYDWYRTQGFL